MLELVEKYFDVCWNENGLDTCENVAHKIIDRVKEDYPDEDFGEELEYDNVLKLTYQTLHKFYGYPI